MSAAQAVQQRAYAPYSKFRVGCALEAEDGTIWNRVDCEVYLSIEAVWKGSPRLSIEE